MSLDVWFQKDIRNVLGALEEANADMMVLCETEESRQYREGYMRALMHVSKALGIEYRYIEADKRTLSSTARVQTNLALARG